MSKVFNYVLNDNNLKNYIEWTLQTCIEEDGCLKLIAKIDDEFYEVLQINNMGYLNILQVKGHESCTGLELDENGYPKLLFSLKGFTVLSADSKEVEINLTKINKQINDISIHVNEISRLSENFSLKSTNSTRTLINNVREILMDLKFKFSM